MLYADLINSETCFKLVSVTFTLTKLLQPNQVRKGLSDMVCTQRKSHTITQQSSVQTLWNSLCKHNSLHSYQFNVTNLKRYIASCLDIRFIQHLVTSSMTFLSTVSLLCTIGTVIRYLIQDLSWMCNLILHGINGYVYFTKTAFHSNHNTHGRYNKTNSIHAYLTSAVILIAILEKMIAVNGHH